MFNLKTVTAPEPPPMDKVKEQKPIPQKQTEKTEAPDIKSLTDLKTKEEKRQFLKQLSNAVKPLVNQGVYTNINTAITEMYKAQNPEITEFNTFHGWRKVGCKVKKGSKAFLVWGTPREIERKKAREAKAKDENADTYEFFPVSYIFSNTQVECNLEER